MKYLLVPILIIVSVLNGKSQLKFDKRYIDCEDKWIAFQKGKDSTYRYGFVYIDSYAGLTFNYEGSFKISADGDWIPKKLENAGIKVRLQESPNLVAIIPREKYEQLQIQGDPSWLKIYKTDSASAQRLYKLGFIYNAWNECNKALGYLKKAQQVNPAFKGLLVELAFSYNCLGDFDKAVKVLKDALRDNPTDAYSNKELIYALIKNEKLSEAAESCRNAIEVCTDKSYNGENCYNLLYAFFAKKDKAKFAEWLDETKKLNSKNERFLQSIKSMESEMAKY